MVAQETSKLSKLGQKSLACSGKKEATEMWHYLVINRVRAHLGDMGLKFLTEKGFTAADLEKLEEWQVVFVKGMNDFLYNMILECIDREGDFGVAFCSRQSSTLTRRSAATWDG